MNKSNICWLKRWKTFQNDIQKIIIQINLKRTEVLHAFFNTAYLSEIHFQDTISYLFLKSGQWKKKIRKRYVKLSSLPYIYLDQILAKHLPHCFMQSSSFEQYPWMPTWQGDSPLVCIPKEWMEVMFAMLMGSLSASKDKSKFTWLNTNAPWEEQNLCWGWCFQLKQFHIQPGALKQLLLSQCLHLALHARVMKNTPFRGHPKTLTCVLCSGVGVPLDIVNFWNDGDVI